MKKIFFIVVLSFSFCLNAMATNYTPWSAWSEYTEVEMVSDDLTDVRKEKRYNYYKYEKILGPYGDASLEYPFVDIDDVSYVCTNWSNETILESSEYEVEIKEFYHYKKVPPINKITVKIEGEYSYDAAAVYMHDEEVSSTLDPMSTHDFLIFHLDKAYDADELDIKLFSDQSHNTEDLIYIKINGYVDDKHYTYMIIGFHGYDNVTASGYYNQPINMDDYYTEEPMILKQNFLIQDEGKVLRYRNCQNKYRTYTLEKKYYDSYTATAIDDYIFMDADDYKDFYSYRQRKYIDTSLESITPLETNESSNSVDNKNTKLNDYQRSEEEATLEVLGETIIPKDNVTPHKVTSNNLTINTNKGNDLYKTISLILLLIIIIILTLSKLYKRYKKDVKV